MLPKCALSMKVRTYNPTPLVHQVKKLINTPPLTANYQATNSFWNHLHTIRKSRNVKLPSELQHILLINLLTKAIYLIGDTWPAKPQVLTSL